MVPRNHGIQQLGRNEPGFPNPYKPICPPRSWVESDENVMGFRVKFYVFLCVSGIFLDMFLLFHDVSLGFPIFSHMFMIFPYVFPYFPTCSWCFPVFFHIFPHVPWCFPWVSQYFSWFHPRVEKPRCIFASSAKMAVSITGAMKPVCSDSSDGTIHGYIIIDNIYIYIYGDGSKPWYLVNPKIAGKWMFIPLKMYL